MAEELSELRENAIPDISSFESVISIETGMIYSEQHGLPKLPRQVTARLRCVVAELGYAVDDEVVFCPSGFDETTIAVNRNNLMVTFGGAPIITTLDTGTATPITPADWVLVVRLEH